MVVMPISSRWSRSCICQVTGQSISSPQLRFTADLPRPPPILFFQGPLHPGPQGSPGTSGQRDHLPHKALRLSPSLDATPEADLTSHARFSWDYSCPNRGSLWFHGLSSGLIVTVCLETTDSLSQRLILACLNRLASCSPGLPALGVAFSEAESHERLRGRSP